MKKTNLIYGIRPIIEAILAGKEIDKLFIQVGLKGDLYKELNELISENRIPTQYVPIEKINKLAPNNNQGVVGFLSNVSYQSLENVIMSAFEEGRTPLVLILDRITDVRNFGAIVRTAECTGIDAVVIPSKGAAQINEDAIKTSAGAVLSVNICREENLKTTIHFLKASGLQMVAATEKARINYTETDFTKPTAIIMGSEEDGVSNEYLKLCDTQLRIPLLGKIQSLNVSVACGVMLYETVRQRSNQ
ncbi:MAG: 23S rRNA (guanosine(2251)-2'-O)-methyltransferase RlmB [Bacteroidales bacterium]|jgi:23S rRNA (guanosine2251-2'-O)-methyltransferase|nr:23S rRNA (guanosine(2251)-2'-O)-methyltransferase RlmB [Bacteroidales bacterium]